MEAEFQASIMDVQFPNETMEDQIEAIIEGELDTGIKVEFPNTFESVAADGFSSPIQIPEPYVGQSWGDEATARQYYVDYAKMKGFGIRTRTSRPGKDFRLVCNREGIVSTPKSYNYEKESNKMTSTLRCNCPVFISVGQCERSGGRWVVRSLHNTHNHPFLSPISKPFLHSNTEMTATAQYFTERFHKVGVPISKVARVLQDEGNFDNTDCYNYMKKLRSQRIEEGDAQGVLRYCQKMKRENPDFFYSMTVDASGRLENFFWVDSPSRMAYQLFGEVITFDTTYRTNKYEMPFAPFVGVNHHLQSTLFGCALLQDESEESFVWVFTTFLEAMNGKVPSAVITDQDQSMGNALKTVMPTARHRLCYWHITNKFPEKLADLYKKGSTFKLEFKRCLRDSRSKKEFKVEWHRIIVEYGLEANTWLEGLFDIRKKWVPIYFRNTFFAGMNTTQRSESMNSFFDNFVHSGTTLREFIEQFQEALKSRIEDCQREDFYTRHKDCILKLKSPLEQHASEVYTRKVFSIFREELMQIYMYKKQKIHEDGPVVTYRVTRHMDAANSTRMTHREVVFHKHSQVASCSCQEFEFRGILCRHILMVLARKEIHKIPTQFILPRWTKNANRLITYTPIPSNVIDVQMLRLHHFNSATRMLQDTFKESHDAYNLVMTGLKDLYIQASKVGYAENEEAAMVDISNTIGSNIMETGFIGDPCVSKTKGRPKVGSACSSNGRYKGGFEQAMDKVRTCHGCGETGHDKRNCAKKSTKK